MHKQLLLGLLFLAVASTTGLAQRPGSIYDPQHGPYGLIAQKTAYRKGDLLTIVISESQKIQNQESNDLAKSTNLNYKINVWDIKPDMFNPLPAVDADSTDNFNGSAKNQKTGTFSARLAAIVIDTLPNGNLVVNGRREIRIDKEVKVMEFTGIVRRLDISAQNTVQSELVANAEVVYRGSGPITDSTQRFGLGGWVHRAWAWIWPF